MYWVKLSGRAPVATITCGHRVAQVSVRCPIFPLKDFTPHCIAQFQRHVDVYIIEENFPIDEDRKVEIFSTLIDGDIDIEPSEEEFVMWLISNGFQPKGTYHKVVVKETESEEENIVSPEVSEEDGKVDDVSVQESDTVNEVTSDEKPKSVGKKKGARRGRTNKRKRK